MKKMIVLLRLMLATVFVFCLTMAASLAWAQVSAPEVPSADVTFAGLITAFGTAAIPWVIWFVAAKVVPAMPRALLPVLPLILGFGVDFVTKWATGIGSPIRAAGVAVGAMILREVLNTLSQHGLAGGGGQVIFKR